MTFLAVDFVLLQVFLVASSESDMGYQEAGGKEQPDEPGVREDNMDNSF